MLGRLRFVVVGAAVLGAAPAFAGVLGPAEDYNVFVFGGMNQSSDSQGPLAVGGNATFTSYSVATNASGSGTNLVVGGNLSGSFGTVNGNAVVAGNVNYDDPTIGGSLTAGGTVTFTGGGGSVNGGVSSVGSYSGPSYITHSSISGPVSLPVDFATAQTTLQNASAALAGLAATGTTGISFGAVTFTGTNATTNVFTISAAQLAAANGITISIPSGADAVINVTGTGSITLPNVGFTLDSAATLWNLEGFTAITTSSFDGSVLAPDADVTFSSGAFDGTLVANSVTGGGQFNEALFTYDPLGSGSPPPTPEPASIALLGLGAAALLARRRRV